MNAWFSTRRENGVGPVRLSSRGFCFEAEHSLRNGARRTLVWNFAQETGGLQLRECEPVRCKARHLLWADYTVTRSGFLVFAK